MIVPELSTEKPIDYDELATLTHLSLQGMLSYEIKVSCSDLADELDVSAQTASRRLQNLEDAGMILREKVRDGQFLTLTPAGYDVLEMEYERYNQLFSEGRPLELVGRVASEQGLTRHVLNTDGYMNQFERKLQYKPEQGTIEMVLERELGQRHVRLNAIDATTIQGWQDGDTAYESISCYPVRLAVDSNETYGPAHVVTTTEFGPSVRMIRLVAPREVRGELDITKGDEIWMYLGGRS